MSTGDALLGKTVVTQGEDMGWASDGNTSDLCSLARSYAKCENLLFFFPEGYLCIQEVKHFNIFWLNMCFSVTVSHCPGPAKDGVDTSLFGHKQELISQGLRCLNAS